MRKVFAQIFAMPCFVLFVYLIPYHGEIATVFGIGMVSAASRLQESLIDETSGVENLVTVLF
jgi:hypothetical protein